MVKEYKEIDEMQNSIFKKRQLDDDSWKRIEEMYKEGVHKQRERSKQRDEKSATRKRINRSSCRTGTKEHITDLLYSDAQRRQEEQRRRLRTPIQAPQQSPMPSSKSAISSRSRSRSQKDLTQKLQRLNYSKFRFNEALNNL